MKQIETPVPRRRVLLQRGLALAGGALGASLAGREALGEPAEVAPGTLQFLGRRRGTAQPGKTKGAATQHVVLSGALLDAAGETTVGSFHTNGFLRGTALGPAVAADSNIAFESFVFPDGTLFGLGPAPRPGAERACAVIGGTGRFAGAHGTYVERAPAGGKVPRGVVEFLFTLNG